MTTTTNAPATTTASVDLFPIAATVEAVHADRALRAELTKRLKINEDAVKAHMAAHGATTGTLDGEAVLTFTVGPDRFTLDVDALIADLGLSEDDLAPYRTKRVAGRKELRFAAAPVVDNIMGTLRALFR